MASKIADFVMLKNGQSINGIVDVAVFTIETAYGKLKFKKTEIHTIHYKNPPHFLSDEIQVSAGTRLEGNVLPDVVPIRVEGQQLIRVPKKDLHTLVFFMSNTRSISNKTRKLLAMIK
jgi:hypothetical protein